MKLLMPHAESYDVIVSGMGPVGATLAALLAQGGVRTCVIDREADLYPLPRAAHFDHEVMRVFQALGVADDILEHTQTVKGYTFVNRDGETLLHYERSGKSHSGWLSDYMFHQPAVERILRDCAQRSGADVRVSTTLQTFEQDADGVSCTLAAVDGAVERVAAKYLIGCDGAWSSVREACGIMLEDLRFDEPWLVVDVKLTNRGRLPGGNLQICDPLRPTTCVHMGPGRHRWEFMLLPGESARDVQDDALIRGWLDQWELGVFEIERRAVYRFHGLVAETWRDRRVFLAGDSAHQMPPFAGQGMCAGIRDAANLNWKLIAVLEGWASDALLDSYTQERRPHVHHIVEAAIAMGRVVCTLDPEEAAERDRKLIAERASELEQPGPHPVSHFDEGFLEAGAPEAGYLFFQPFAEKDGHEIRLDDRLSDRFTLISTAGIASATDPLPVAVLHIDDPILAPFRERLTAWLEEREVDAVLVRPDRYVFGTGSPEELLSNLRRQLDPALMEKVI